MDINSLSDAVDQLEQLIAFLQQDESENYVLIDMADALLSEIRAVANDR